MNIKIEQGYAGESILIKDAGTSTANGRYYKFSSTKYIALNGNGNTIELIISSPNYWVVKDISTREATGPGDPPEYAYAYRNFVADPKSASFFTSWTVDLGQSQAPTSSYSFGGKVTSTKGGSGKLIEKKYIDFFPLNNEIGTIALSGGGWGNGIYTRSFIASILITNSTTVPNGIYRRSSGGTTKFIVDNANAEIWWNNVNNYWVFSELGELNGEATLTSYDLINWQSGTSTWDGKAEIRDIYFIKSNTEKIIHNVYNYNFVSIDTNAFGNAGIYYSEDGVKWINEGSLTDQEAGTLPTGDVQKCLSYIFDPIFYKKDIANSVYKIIAVNSELNYVNGVYSQTVNPKKSNGYPYFIKDDDGAMSISWNSVTEWQIIDSSLRNGMEVLWQKSGGGKPDEINWTQPEGGEAFGQYEPPAINLYESNVLNNELDPSYLEKLRSYTVDKITIPGNINILQKVKNAPFNTRKVKIKNNALSYIKYDDDSDVPKKNFKKFIGNVEEDSIFLLKDLDTNLLTINKDYPYGLLSNWYPYGGKKDSTLNIFIRLQRPSEHKHGEFKVRHKRSTFCYGSGIRIGYRSPYYNIPGRPSYKGKFNNFSFVFTIGDNNVFSDIFNRPSSFTLMTDYKYNFGEMYMLTIRLQDNKASIFINGELQTVALIPFNPLVSPKRLASRGQYKKSYSQRKAEIPLSPGFYMLDGTIYPYLDQEYDINRIAFVTLLHFGPNKFSKSNPKKGNILNNLDIGVISSYHISLSEADIKNIYENFRYKYI